jgi:hypothetical protein
LTFGVVAAAAASSPATGNVTPGVLGFLVVAAMGVALVFLLRSMNKQFRKITPITPIAPEAETERAEGAEGIAETRAAKNETPKQDTPT